MRADPHERALAACVLALICSSLARPVTAEVTEETPNQPPSSRAQQEIDAASNSRVEEPSAPPELTLTLVGAIGPADALEARTLSWFNELPTLTSAGRAQRLDKADLFAARRRAGVRVWILALSPALIRLFFAVEAADAAAPRYLVRDVSLDGGLDELGMEQVAQLVYLSTLGLWSGRMESSRRDVELGLGEPPSNAANERTGVRRGEPVQSEMLAAPVRLVPGVEYAARYAGDEGLFHGPAARLGLEFRGSAFALGPRLHAQLELPHSVHSGEIELRLRGSRFALGVAGALGVGGAAAELELGAGLDVVEVQAMSNAWRAQPSDTDLRPFAFLALAGERKFGFLRLSLAATLAASLVTTHYDVLEGGRRKELLRPWLAQPGLRFGAVW